MSWYYFFVENVYMSIEVRLVMNSFLLSWVLQWAVNILKKPIVNISWLYQCWKQHRIVPQDSFRVLPFSGLIICVTKVPAGWQLANWSKSWIMPAIRCLCMMSMPIIIRLMCAFTSDERKEMEKLVNQNGGTYSPELNKKCTHLVCDIS